MDIAVIGLIIAVYAALTSTVAIWVTIARYRKEKQDTQLRAQSALKYELLDAIRSAESNFPAPIPTHVWDTMKGELSHTGLLIGSEASALYAEIRRFNENVKSDEQMKTFHNLPSRKQSRLFQQGQTIVQKARYIYGILNALETAGKKGQQA